MVETVPFYTNVAEGPNREITAKEKYSYRGEEL
jgi:hypothetical protein